MKNIARNLNLKLIGIILLFSLVIPLFLFGMENFSLSPKCFEIEQTKICSGVNSEQISSKNEIVSSFSTDYSKSPTARKYNIRLALKSLDNVVVKGGEELSFNKVVGMRTEERGYKKALVIFKGSYVEGVGGGVCQVSTTLYNAWLLAGLDALSVKAHTLPASYVDLSRDATVSEYIDLVLRNPYENDVTIKTEFDDDKITIKILGKNRGYSYNLKSEVLETIPFEEDIIELDEIGDDEYFNGKDGYVSRLILSIVKGGRVVAKRELRKDYYKPQNSVKIVRKSPLN